LTPNRTGRAISSTPSSFTPQQKFRLSSIGNPVVQQQSDSFQRDDFLSRAKENVSVTVRFRPLNQREIQRGDEVAWYADGDSTVRSELCLSTAYAFDRVFAPATTTRGVYDVAAQHVVSGAMQGVNGTVIAYGVTSSGKTHTMHVRLDSWGFQWGHLLTLPFCSLFVLSSHSQTVILGFRKGFQIESVISTKQPY